MNPHIEKLRQELRTVGPAAVETFWAEVRGTGTPLVQPLDDGTSLVTFLWRGAANTTSVEWGVRLPLERLDGTDLWHGSIVLPTDLRTVYYLAHGGATGAPVSPDGGATHIDPLNPRRFLFPGDPLDPTDRDNWTSLLELPGAAPEPWLAPPAPAARGSTVEADVDSAVLGGARNVSVHLPPGREPDGLPVLVVFDGSLSRSVLRVESTVDNLVAAGRIPPLAVIFVNTPDGVRDHELQPQPPIATFVADELWSWAQGQWRLGGDPAYNTVAGASRGGLTAAYVARCRPDRFGAVISQSGSFWWPRVADGEPEWLTRQYGNGPRLPLRFYLDVGSREDGPGLDGGPSQVEVNRRLRDTLHRQGYPVAYAEYTGGHDYVNWRRTFADGLIAVYSTPV